MLTVYVINLMRNPERRTWMERELTKAGVTGTSFVNAVDGQRFGAPCEAWLKVRAINHRLSKNEAAVVLSHRKAWRAMLASGGAPAVVLEDDVHLGQDFKELLAVDWGRWDFDIVKLETMRNKVWLSRQCESVNGRRLHCLRSIHWGAAAYVISAAGARKMLERTRTEFEPINSTLFGHNTISTGRFSAFQLVPAIAVQDIHYPDRHLHVGLGSWTSTSDLGRSAFKRHKLKGWRRVGREVRRIVDQFASLVNRAQFMTRVKFK